MSAAVDPSGRLVTTELAGRRASAWLPEAPATAVLYGGDGQLVVG